MYRYCIAYLLLGMVLLYLPLNPIFAQDTLTVYGIDSSYTVAPPPGYIPYWAVDEDEVVEAAAEAEYLPDTARALSIQEAVGAFDYIPYLTDEQIGRRIEQLPSVIPLVYNEKVRGFIDYFSILRREYILRIMARTNLYFPLFEKVLAEEGLPDGLKYLSIVESALIPNALSRVGAKGLWQFMPATGRMFGLNINYYIDERMDPEKSTRAAAKYLKSLYGMFNDWELAIAAYNCGPGNVRKALRRSGGKRFWEVYRYLPRETRSYLPQLVAITYLLQNAEAHNLVQEQPYYPTPVVEVAVSQSIDFVKLCEALRICLDDLKLLNPEVRHGVLPDYIKNYPLKIPEVRYQAFSFGGDSLLEAIQYSAKSQPHLRVQGSRNSYYHIVRRGESLGLIAQRNGVSLSKLRQWNDKWNNSIYPGQKLLIYGDNRSAGSKKPAPTPEKQIEIPENAETYTVQSGDRLWDIAKKIEGVSVQDLMSLNKLKTSRIYPGQKIIIRQM